MQNILTIFLISLITSLTISADTLVVYDNLALFSKSEKIKIKKEDNKLYIDDIPKNINLDAINITTPNGLSINSINYVENKLSKNSIIDANIDKYIRYKDEKGILLSCEGEFCFIKTKDKKIKLIKLNDIVFDTLASKSKIVCDISTNKDIDDSISIDYEIKNMNYKSNYILNIIDEKHANIEAWIDINNNSTNSFKNTKLFVVAGDINRVQKNISPYIQASFKQNRDAPTQIAHSGYHIYKIRDNIYLNKHKLIKYIDKKNIIISTKYISNLSNPQYMRGYKKNSVNTHIFIKPIDKNLPKGVVKVYSKIKDTKIFLGENKIYHTPKNSPFDINIGDDSDSFVSEELINRDDDKIYYKLDIKYTIQNYSNKNKEVTLKIPFNKNRKNTISTAQKYSFTKGNLITFNIKLLSNSSKQFNVKYRIKKGI